LREGDDNLDIITEIEALKQILKKCKNMAPMKPQYFMSTFDFYVNDYRGDPRNLIHTLCGELFERVHKYGLTSNSDQVDVSLSEKVEAFLVDHARHFRNNPNNQPKLEDFRRELTRILGG